MKKSRVVEGEDDSSSGEEQQQQTTTNSASRRLSVTKSRTSVVRNNRRSMAFRQPPSAVKRDDEEEAVNGGEGEGQTDTTTAVEGVARAQTPDSTEVAIFADSNPSAEKSVSPAPMTPCTSPSTRASKPTMKCPPLEPIVIKRRIPRREGTSLPTTQAESMLQIGKELNPVTMGGGGAAVTTENTPFSFLVDKAVPRLIPTSSPAVASVVWLNPRYDKDPFPGGSMSEAAWEDRHGVPGRLGLSAHRAIRAEFEHIYNKGVNEGFLQPVGAMTQKSIGHAAATGRAMRSVQAQCDAINGFVLDMWGSNTLKINKPSTTS